jgi:hypothetical protein
MDETIAIGMALGMGLAAGVLLAGILAGWRHGLVASVLGAVGIGIVAGLLVRGWLGLPGGMVGAIIGAVSAGTVVRGALRRGATVGPVAFMLACAAIAIAFVSIIPFVGYVLAVVLPVVAYRRVRSEPDRYGGLRTLAK